MKISTSPSSPIPRPAERPPELAPEVQEDKYCPGAPRGLWEQIQTYPEPVGAGIIMGGVVSLVAGAVAGIASSYVPVLHHHSWRIAKGVAAALSLPCALGLAHQAIRNNLQADIQDGYYPTSPAPALKPGVYDINVCLGQADETPGAPHPYVARAYNEALAHLPSEVERLRQLDETQMDWSVHQPGKVTLQHADQPAEFLSETYGPLRNTLQELQTPDLQFRRDAQGTYLGWREGDVFALARSKGGRTVVNVIPLKEKQQLDAPPSRQAP